MRPPQRWSALTSMRFPHRGVQAFRSVGAGVVRDVNFKDIGTAQGTAGRGVTGAAERVSTAGFRPGARAVRTTGPADLVVCTITCA